MKGVNFLSLALALTMVLSAFGMIFNVLEIDLAGTADGKVLNVPGSYSTIQDAIDDADPGDTVLIGNGTYTEILSIGKSLILKGNSTNFVNIISYGSGDMITVTSDDVSISKMTLEHRGLIGEGSCIHVQGVENVSINSVKTFSATGSGILLNGSDLCKVFDIEAWGNKNGITVNSSDDNEIAMCHVHDNSVSGIFLWGGSDNNSVDSCFLTDNEDYGLRSVVSTLQNRNEILNCTMNYSKIAAIYLDGNNTNWVITNNHINDTDGIETLKSQGLIASYNSITNFTHNGVFLYESVDCEINDNFLVSENSIGHVGITLQRTNFTSVHNNIFGENSIGVLGIGPFNHNNDVYSNDLENTDMGIWFAHATAINIYDNNLICSSGAIYLDNTSNVLVSDNIIQNSPDGIVFYVSNGSNIINNKISNCTYGFKSDDLSTSTIESNSMYECSRGFQVKDSKHLAIKNNVIELGFTSIFTDNLVHSSIMGNRIVDARFHGMYINGPSTPSMLEIIENQLFSNELGILIFNGSDISLGMNIIEDSVIFGLDLGFSTSNILIDHNIFIGNNPGDDQTNDDGTGNKWNLPWPDGGNHWSDYEGRDIYKGISQDIPGMDGFGDTPHPIGGSAGSEDLYPLIDPSGSFPSGDIIITSHVHGEHVSGMELFEADVTIPIINSVIWSVNGMQLGVDVSYPYQLILDTTHFPDGTLLNITAEADIPGTDNKVDEVQVKVSNDVLMGPFVDISTAKLLYHPDQLGTALIDTNDQTPFCKEVRIILNLNDPLENTLFISDGIYLLNDQWSLPFPIPSDAELGEWSLNITVFGQAGGAVLWFDNERSLFEVIGDNTYDRMTSLQDGLSILDFQNSSLNQLLDMFSVFQEDLLYMNETNEFYFTSILMALETVETNLALKIDGMNSDFLDLLNLRLTDISDLLNSISGELNIELNDIDSSITSLDLRLEECCNNTAELIMALNSSINEHMVQMQLEVQDTIDSCCSTLQGIIPYLHTIEQNLSSGNIDVLSRIDVLEGLMIDLSNTTVNEIRSGVTELMDYLLGLNTSEAQRHALTLSEMLQQLDQLNSSLFDHMDDIQSALDALSQLTDIVEDLGTLEAQVESTQGNVEDGNDQNTILLIALIIGVIISLILIILLVIRTGKEYDVLEET